MDIQNATAAGPGYGLFDVIFGNAPDEAAEADGQKFQPLMDLMKALKNKGEEEPKLEGSRTETETATGKDAADVRVVGIPEMFASMALMQQQMQQTAQQPRLAALSEAMAGADALAAGPDAAAKLGQMDPKLVNAMLKEKSLPPLNEAEMKLLADVNAKMANADQKLARLQAASMTDSEPKAADKADNAAADRLLQALAARGIDPEKLKSAVAGAQQQAAPDKFMSTEAYLRMHEAIGQPNGKKAQVEKNSRMEIESDMRQSPLEQARERLAQQGGEQPKEDLLGGSKQKLDQVLEGGDKKLPRESTMPFAATLVQHLKGGGGIDAKDVYLDGMKPEAMRTELMQEVTGAVHLNAMRGGGEMRLVIHPEEMGEVKLKIAAGRDGKIEVKVTTETKEVAELIRGGSKDLQASLGDQNLQLARFEVTVADQAVSSLEPKGSLSEQMMQNSQNGFQQPASDDSRFARWDGAQQDSRQGGAFLQEDENYNRREAHTRPALRQNPARDSSRRLDVVA